MEENGMLQQTLGEYGRNDFERMDRNHDGKLTRGEVKKHIESNRVTDVDKSLAQGVLDDFSFIKNGGFVRPDKDNVPANLSYVAKDEFRAYSERGSLNYSHQRGANLSEPQVEELAARRVKELRDRTGFEAQFGTADNLMAEYDSNDNGTLDAYDITKALEKSQPGDKKLEALPKVFVTVNKEIYGKQQ